MATSISRHPRNWSRDVRFLLLCLLGLVSCEDHQAAALKQLTARGYSLSVEQFFKAARAGDAEAVRLFVDAGLEPSVRDAQGQSAIGEAVKAGSVAAVDALLSCGAKCPHERMNETLVDAVRSHQLAVVKALLGAGVKPDAAAQVSPLVEAARESQQEMLDLLLPSGVGQVQQALLTAAETGNVAVLSRLLRGGAHVFVRESSSARTPLMIAAAKGHDSAVELLLACGSDRLALDGAGQCALDIARESNLASTVALLSVPITVDERRRPLRLKEATLKLASTAPLVPSVQFVFLGCHEETLPFELESLEADSVSLRWLADQRSSNLTMDAVVPDTAWVLKKLSPVGWLGQPSVIFRDRDSWKHLLLVPQVPARWGRLCAWLQLVADGSFYEVGEGDRFVLTGEGQAAFVVQRVTPMQVVIAHEANAAESWSLKPGGLR